MDGRGRVVLGELNTPLKTLNKSHEVYMLLEVREFRNVGLSGSQQFRCPVINSAIIILSQKIQSSFQSDIAISCNIMS